jgi:hypothetical protein
MRKRLERVLGIGVATLVVMTAGTIGVSSAAAARAAVTIPVTVLGGQDLPGGVQPLVEVRVGRSARVPVILDTGSSGLHIFANAVATGPASGVTVTSTPANITYAGGHRFIGVLASATINIGTQPTAHSTPFALVQHAVCIASKPVCPAAGGISGFERQGIYGILGIGTATSKGPIASPILAMPGQLGNSWSLHLAGKTGALVLGARVPSPSSSVAMIPMRRTGSWGTHALWADASLRLCTAVGTVEDCTPTLFDSGTAAFQLWGPTFLHVPRSSPTQVTTGTPVRMSQRGAATPFWSFVAGSTRSKDLVVVRGGTGPFVNVGVQGYFDFTITYDDVTGVVVLNHALH